MYVHVTENLFSQHNTKPHRGFSSRNKKNEEKVYLDSISRDTNCHCI